MPDKESNHFKEERKRRKREWTVKPKPRKEARRPVRDTVTCPHCCETRNQADMLECPRCGDEVCQESCMAGRNVKCFRCEEELAEEEARERELDRQEEEERCDEED